MSLQSNRKTNIWSAVNFTKTHGLDGQYKTQTADYGLGIKHTLRYKTQTKHYGLGIKYGLGYKTRTEHYGLGINHGLGYEQVHTGCKLHPLSVLRAKATSLTSYVTWPM